VHHARHITQEPLFLSRKNSDQNFIQYQVYKSREECIWMCSFYHPDYGCISFVNIYRVKLTKKGVPFCEQLTRLTFIVCNMWGVEES
jgi:hypothetical protein